MHMITSTRQFFLFVFSYIEINNKEFPKDNILSTCDIYVRMIKKN
jgi:hypothetical protein